MKRSKNSTVKNTFAKLSIISAISLSVLAGYSTHSMGANTPVKKVNHFAENAFGNAVALEQSPIGVYANGVTYVTYQGTLEDPFVAAYNHDTGEWQGPVKAGFSELGKDPSLAPSGRPIDNHGKPTMVIDDLGYIHIFFGGHGGSPRHGENPLGDLHDGKNKHVVSKNPYDISEWLELDNIPPFGNYNQAVKMDNGDIYLFYRHGAHESDWVYQKSTDHGRTFEEPVSYLKTKDQTHDHGNGWDSWYSFVRKGEGDEIMVAYDYHNCYDVTANGERGHTTERHNLYYMTFNTKTGEWKNIEGEEVTFPVTYETANEETLAIDTGDKWTFGPTVSLAADGNPYIGIAIGTDLGRKTGGPKQNTLFKWDGDEWAGVNNPVNAQARIDGMDTRGDFFVDDTTGDVTYALGYKEVNKDGVISYYSSSDEGETFTKSQELLRGKNTGYAISAMIENAHPDARFVVAQRRGLKFGKVYLIGDNGPVEREVSDLEEEL